MTKLKSKKMTKSTFAIIIMAIAMVAMLAFGGTYAVFTAETSELSGSITTAKISLKNGSSVSLTGNYGALLPGETVGATVEYTDDSTRGTYIVIQVSADKSAVSSSATVTLTDLVDTATSDALTATKYTKSGSDNIYVIKNSKAGDTTSDVVSKSSISLKLTLTFNATENNKDASSSLSDMGKTITLTFTAKSIQVSGHATEAAAVEALGFTGYTAA